jgi:hypothetical protein
MKKIKQNEEFIYVNNAGEEIKGSLIFRKFPTFLISTEEY